MAEDYYARMALYRKRMKDMIKRAALSTWMSVERVIGGCVCMSRCIKCGVKGISAANERSDIAGAKRYHARVIIRRVNDKIVSQS